MNGVGALMVGKPERGELGRADGDDSGGCNTSEKVDSFGSSLGIGAEAARRTAGIGGTKLFSLAYPGGSAPASLRQDLRISPVWSNEKRKRDNSLHSCQSSFAIAALSRMTVS